MRHVNISEIEISANRRNVKYQGCALDKCSISSLIHDVARDSKHFVSFPLWSDIYWNSVTKSELVDYLIFFMS